MKYMLDRKEIKEFGAKWLKDNYPDSWAAGAVLIEDSPLHVFAAMLVDEKFIGRIERLN